MCGICGVLNFSGSPVLREQLDSMNTALAHRGPDGEGVFTDGPLGLAHRRLAILDLSSAGQQPMLTADGRHVISYNGEVYNFRELRCQLEGLGHVFRSECDTEVVLNAFVQWGAKAVERFNGMFALAIYDRRERKLFLARDRYGIKPLYYAFQNGAFFFASEQKAILHYPGFVRRVDSEAVLEYFTFQNLFSDRTFLQGVRLFPAGHHATLDCAHPADTLPFRQYWDFHFREPEHPLDENEYVEEADRLFRQAVRRQLVSDVEVGAFLSGGIDSGSIVAEASRHTRDFKTFTCGFDLHSASGLELAFDERERAEQLSYLFKTRHYEMVLKAGDMEACLPQLVRHLEEPRVGQSYPNYYAAHLASKFCTVVLAGTGGDELFAGYPWRYPRSTATQTFDEYVDSYYLFWQRLIPNSLIKKVFRPVWGSVEHVWTRDIFRDVFPKHLAPPQSSQDFINHSLYFECKTFLHGLLVVEDKLTMAHGLEARVPFLDNDLVDFAMQVPVACKLKHLNSVQRIDENEPGSSMRKNTFGKQDGKIIMRKCLQRHVPEDMLKAAKQGFSGPDATWFKGESIDFVRNVIFNDHSRLFDYLDRQAVRELVREHLDGKQNRRLLIWSLLNFEQWLNEFMEAA
jgi:asparagine synthase (glutamine-hydrolyzing)